jgi:GH18 family chitinase
LQIFPAALSETGVPGLSGRILQPKEATMHKRIQSAVIDTLEARQHLSRNQVVGYLTNYSIAGGKIDINKIDYSALTQINYFAAIPADNGTLTLSDTEKTRLDSVIAKAHSYGVKVSLSLGGAGQDQSLTAIVSDVVGGNTNAYEALATSLSTIQANHHIDGVDLDWEPLNTSTRRIENYGLLLKKLQDNTNMQVSAAVNAERLWGVVGGVTATNPDGRAYVLDEKGIKALDQISVMAYDLETANHSSWTRTTADLDAWVAEVERFGKPRDMLVFGLPFYGRSGTDWNNPMPSYKSLINNRLAQNPGQPISDGADSLWVAFPSEYPGYNNGQGIEWFFNSKNTVIAKTMYANTQAQVGGVMVWDLAQDHTDSNLQYTNYSLLPSIRAATNAQGTVGATGTYAANASKPTFEVTFTQAPDAATLGPADLILKNLTTGQTINTATESHLHFNGNTVGWSFHDGLADGNYQATLRGGSVRTATGNPLSTDLVANFFVLAGDANRDRTVGFDDLVPLAQNYNGTGKTFAQGDFDYDSDVDFQDLVILSQQYSKTLAAVALISLPFSNTAIFGSPTLSAKPAGTARSGSRVAGDVLA